MAAKKMFEAYIKYIVMYDAEDRVSFFTYLKVMGSDTCQTLLNVCH